MRVALGLGSSIGPRRRLLERVLRRLDGCPELQIIRTSSWYRTPPLVGGTARGWFLNGVSLFEASCSPERVMELCFQMEERMGRRRNRHWGDRTVDIDLLLADMKIIEDRHLTVPHPAIADRAFVLLPLLEVWPDARDPRTGNPWAESPDPPGPRPVRIGVVARSARSTYLECPIATV